MEKLIAGVSVKRKCARGIVRGLAVSVLLMVLVACEDPFGSDSDNDNGSSSSGGGNSSIQYHFRNESNWEVRVSPAGGESWSGFTLEPEDTVTVSTSQSRITYSLTRADGVSGWVTRESLPGNTIRIHNRTILMVWNRTESSLSNVRWGTAISFGTISTNDIAVEWGVTARGTNRVTWTGNTTSGPLVTLNAEDQLSVRIESSGSHQVVVLRPSSGVSGMMSALQAAPAGDVYEFREDGSDAPQ